MREIVHLQAGQCGNQIGAKVRWLSFNPIDFSFEFYAFEKIRFRNSNVTSHARFFELARVVRVLANEAIERPRRRGDENLRGPIGRLRRENALMQWSSLRWLIVFKPSSRLFGCVGSFFSRSSRTDESIVAYCKTISALVSTWSNFKFTVNEKLFARVKWNIETN